MRQGHFTCLASTKLQAEQVAFVASWPWAAGYLLSNLMHCNRLELVIFGITDPMELGLSQKLDVLALHNVDIELQAQKCLQPASMSRSLIFEDHL